MAFLSLLFFMLLSMLAPYAALAQNDFPFYPGYPSTQQPFVPGVPPVPLQDFVWDGSMAWQQVDARRGDVIEFEYVMDWWGFAIVTTSPMISSGSGMEYIPGGSAASPEHQQWGWGDIGYFCFRCRWRVTARDDYPWMWISYTGSNQFGAHLEIVQITTNAPKQAVTQAKKDAARDKAAKQDAWSYGLNTLAGNCFGRAPWEICVGIAAAAGAFYLDARRLDRIANDPWDPLFYEPYEPSFNFPINGQLDWYTWLPENDPLGMGSYINNYVWNATVADGYNDMAAVSADRFSSAEMAGDGGSADMQYWRARWALEQSGNNYHNIAWNVSVFAWFFENYWNPYVDLPEPDYLSNHFARMAQSYSELANAFSQ